MVGANSDNIPGDVLAEGASSSSAFANGLSALMGGRGRVTMFCPTTTVATGDDSALARALGLDKRSKALTNVAGCSCL